MTARILVVDDVEPNVRLLEAKLTLEYYEVLTATDGASALEIAAAESPDIVHDKDARAHIRCFLTVSRKCITEMGLEM